MQYRRTRIAGGTYFFTVNLEDRRSTLLVQHIELLRQSMIQVQRRHPFRIGAIVVLPDHLHTLWTLPPQDSDYATRWSLIKATFSRSLPALEARCTSRKTKRERGIWQRRYWEHMIRHEQDWKAHVDYIHFNPVKHGHVPRARDWPYSSLHNYVRKGLLPEDWGDDFRPIPIITGEP